MEHSDELTFADYFLSLIHIYGLALRRKGRFVMDDYPHIRFSLHAPDQQDAPCCGAEVDRT